MRVTLLPAPWYEEPPTQELLEACEILGDGTWREAAVGFYAERAARVRRGRSAPKGMQMELNKVVSGRLGDAGWAGADGRYAKEQTWVRVTFRHQMSLGSDILDAARLCAREGYVQAAILAAESGFLRVISPNDHHALVSFEKLRIAVAELQDVLDIPLFMGALSAQSTVPPDIAAELRKERPRDRTIPATDPRRSPSTGVS